MLTCKSSAFLVKAVAALASCVGLPAACVLLPAAIAPAWALDGSEAPDHLSHTVDAAQWQFVMSRALLQGSQTR